jgi:hypothetical protein
MMTGILSRLRNATRPDLDNVSAGAPSLLARLTSPNAELVSADATWHPDTRPLRIEIMADGSFESLCRTTLSIPLAMGFSNSG